MKRTIIFGYKWKSQLTYNVYRAGYVYIIGMCCPFKLTRSFGQYILYLESIQHTGESTY